MFPVAPRTRLGRGEDPVAGRLEDVDRPPTPEALADLFNFGLDLLARERPGDEPDARIRAGDSFPGRGEAGDADTAASGDERPLSILLSGAEN